jgi:fermentation-respiration switch protein FrsA (DUF1100 family)
MAGRLRMITTVLITATALYLVFATTVYLFQDHLLFLAGVPGREIQATPTQRGLDYQDLWLHTADGETLHAWLIPAPERRATVLFLHGNAGNISHRLDSIALFYGLGLEVLILDYRGYGQSTGRPSEAGLYRDAEAGWRYLTRTLARRPSEIVVFGRSLGGAVAAWLAERTRPGALIIESTFTSLPDLAACLYPWLPARALARMRFDTHAALAWVGSPVLVIHSRDDEIVPYAQARTNYEAIPGPKQFLEQQGGHNEGFWITRERYREALDAFLSHHMADHTRAAPG